MFLSVAHTCTFGREWADSPQPGSVCQVAQAHFVLKVWDADETIEIGPSDFWEVPGIVTVGCANSLSVTVRVTIAA